MPPAFLEGGGGGGGGGKEGAVRFQPIQPVVDAHVCKLLLQRGGGGGGPFSPEEGGHGPPWGCPWEGVVKCICMNIHTESLRSEERGTLPPAEKWGPENCVCVWGGGGGGCFYANDILLCKFKWSLSQHSTI